MTTETGTAFLVDPMGHAPETLSQREYEAIHRYLDMPDGPACQAAEWLFHMAEKDPMMDEQAVLHLILSRYGNDRPGECTGMLARIFGKSTIEDLTTRETEILQDTLTAIRVGGWFPEWLRLQVRAIAGGEGIPGDRHPTPLQIAASLTLCIQEHEEALEAARQFAQRRPDLIAGATIEPLVKQVPSVAAETTQPATKPPAKVRRARKPRKQATRA